MDRLVGPKDQQVLNHILLSGSGGITSNGAFWFAQRIRGPPINLSVSFFSDWDVSHVLHLRFYRNHTKFETKWNPYIFHLAWVFSAEPKLLLMGESGYDFANVTGLKCNEHPKDINWSEDIWS
jgi:hypothetical protein